MIEEQASNIVLYGAGTQNLRMAYQPIVSAGYQVKAICDKDTLKQGKKFYGIEIISPDELKILDEKIDKYIVVITIRTLEIVRTVKAELEVLKNASIFTFEEFIEYATLNCKVKRFSCIMTHLVDHCNLNCVRCSHFSPLDTEHKFYLKPEDFEMDCKRLSELMNGYPKKVDEFQLSGGETLLHPEVEKFPYIIKKYFSEAKIIIITNGTLLLKQKEAFYQSCRDNDVQIWISKYPIGLNYNEITAHLDKEKIDYEIGNSGNSDEHPKEMWGLPLKLDGQLDQKKNFECCLCMQYILRAGRIYPCANSAYIDLFNNYFGKELPGPEVNGVDIYEVDSFQELTEKISTPIPLCEFCDSRHRMQGIPWRVSRREIGEWILE